MDRATQCELVGRVLDQHAGRTTTLADTALRIPAERYVSEEFHRREGAALFRGRPVLACLSADIPEPGDGVALESGGVPIVVVRASDGTPRAFVNVCRHRGATVLEQPARGLRNLSCPFHGWVYDLDDGHLIGRPRSCEGFAELDGTCSGLPPLGVAEAHGLVVVDTGGATRVDVDGWLAGLGPELEGLGLAQLVAFRSERRSWACNWKLLLDTFLESYHVFSLHRSTLAAYYLGIASPFDAFGPHNRIVVPQADITTQTDRPRDEWELFPHAVVQYHLAPNVILSNLYGYVMTWRFVPHGAGSTTVEHALYTYRPAADDEDRAHFDQRFEAARAVTAQEDFPQSETIHANLAAGTLDATTAGRNEPGVVHFHRFVHEALSATDAD